MDNDIPDELKQEGEEGHFIFSLSAVSGHKDTAIIPETVDKVYLVSLAQSLCVLKLDEPTV